MYEDNDSIIDISDGSDISEKSDIEEVREKYENRKSRKADEIIAVQAVICILLATGFFVANIFYPQICRELYDILESSVTDTSHIVPYISDYL